MFERELTDEQREQEIATLEARIAALKHGRNDRPEFHNTLREALDKDLPGLLKYWNEVSCDESPEIEENDENCLEAPTYTFGQPDLADIKKRFPCLTIRSSSPPPPIRGIAAGRYEALLHEAIQFDVKRLLETASPEPEWTARRTVLFLAGWAPLTPYYLEEAKNLVKEVADNGQERWNTAKRDSSVQSTSVRVDSVFKLIHSWFTPKDWLSLYRSQPRTLFAIDGRSTQNTEDRQILNMIEHHLFDTTKYNGECELMTVITYDNDFNYGTVTLLRVSLSRHLALHMDTLGSMRDVPRAILKNMQRQQQIKLISKEDKIKYLQLGDQEYPYLMSVQTVTTITRKKLYTPWKIGDGWRRALGIKHDPTTENDGLVATIPQMVALLHLKGSGLYDLHSSEVFTFSSPVDRNSTISRYDINRGIRINLGPKGMGHTGKVAVVVVLFPSDSDWAHERILWA
jgi:hypothetical protein